MSDNSWSKWWFLSGGIIHGLWKSRQYKKIKELANNLPKAAWDYQQEKINKLKTENVELKDFQVVDFNSAVAQLKKLNMPFVLFAEDKNDMPYQVWVQKDGTDEYSSIIELLLTSELCHDLLKGRLEELKMEIENEKTN